jgi:hypothetical protein
MTHLTLSLCRRGCIPLLGHETAELLDGGVECVELA